MSTYCVRSGVAALVVCLAFAACDDNPVDESRGDAASLTINPTFAVVTAADSTRVDANARDRYGELTRGQVSFSACDDKIRLEPDPSHVTLEPPDRTLVFGLTLGESCVNVSGPGGLSATATVEVLPASVEVEVLDVLGSGASAQAQVTFFDATGAVASGFDASNLDFTVADPSIADVDEAGNVTGKAPGSTDLTATLKSEWAIPRSGSQVFTVVPGQFDGTVSPASANWGDTITVTAGALAFDDDTRVEFDGLTPYLVSQSSTEIVVVGPAGMGGSPSEVLVLAVGENQLALATSVEVPNPDPADSFEPNNGGGGGGGSLSNLTETSPASLPFEEWISAGSLDLDDVFRIEVLVPTTIDFSIDWNYEDADLDLLFYGATGALISNFGCASTAVPETCSVAFATGVYYIDVNVFDAHGHDYATVLLKMTPQ